MSDSERPKRNIPDQTDPRNQEWEEASPDDLEEGSGTPPDGSPREEDASPDDFERGKPNGHRS